MGGGHPATLSSTIPLNLILQFYRAHVEVMELPLICTCVYLTVKVNQFGHHKQVSKQGHHRTVYGWTASQTDLQLAFPSNLGTKGASDYTVTVITQRPG